MRKFIVVAALLLVSCTGYVHAQSTSASLTGYITDPAKAFIPQAKVLAINLDTNVRQEVATDKNGGYYITGLIPGRYRIEVEKPGFKTVVKSDIDLHVQDTIAINFEMVIGSASEIITVEARASMIDTESSAVGLVVDRQFVANMPLNGRSFQSLIDLAPGVTVTASSYSSQGQFSVNGQRTDTNYFTVDGVSANASVGTGGAINSAGGGALPLTAAGGGYNNLVSIDALQEFQIHTSTMAPEFGRTPGGQISLLSRSGSNAFHGDAFDYLRNDAFDAKDWFANAANLAQPTLRQNDFGGVFGGPIIKNKLFFFASYEGLRETFAVPSFMGVPSLCARANAFSASNAPNATAILQQWLNAYPLPNGPDVPEVFGLTCHDLNPSLPTSMKLISQYNANLPTTSTLNATSIRVDYNLTARMNIFGRYNYAPSSSSVRSGAEVTNTHIAAQSLTLGQIYTLNPILTNDLRFNYSTVTPLGSFAMTNFGGAVPVPDSVIFPSPYSASTGEFLFNPGSGGSTVESLAAGTAVSNHQQQFNLVDSISVVKGPHQLKFGVDWRQLTPRYNAPPFQIINNFGAPEALPFGGFFPGGLNVAVNSPHAEELRYQNYSLYAQDTWRANSKLTLTYGLRWEINPAPTSPNGTPLLAINQLTTDLMNIHTLPLGSQLYATTWDNIAPRIGAAYALSSNPTWGRVLRGGFGIFYDTASTATSFTNGPYFPQNVFFSTNFPLPVTAPPGQASLLPLPPLQLLPPYSRAIDTTDPHLKLPYVYQFNAAWEQFLGKDQTLTTRYVGAIGRRLIRQDDYPSSSLNSNFFTNDLSPYVNSGTSDYHAFQVEFKRRLTRGFQAYASYTWSHSIDTGSVFTYTAVPSTFISPRLDRGNSDFDIQHQFNVAATYDIPAWTTNRLTSAVLSHWSLDGMDHFRTATPIYLTAPAFNYTDSNGVMYPVVLRPNVVPGQPFYVHGAQCAAIYGTGTTNGIIGNGSLALGQSCPGGVGLNPAAFVVAPPTPNGQPISQGTLPRNVLRSFGAQEVDITLRRDFSITEGCHLEFRVDLFNIFNHPNFGPPTNFQVNNMTPIVPSGGVTDFSIVSQGFGISRELLSNALGSGNGTNGGKGGFSPLYNLGGPRSIQLSLKFRF